MCLYSSRSLQRVLAGAMTFLCLIFLLSACTTNTQTVQSQPHPSLSSQMDAYLLSLVKAHQFRGAVLIASSGKVLLSKGYDMANTDLSLANTPTTMFGIGSVTKAFTAMAILLLEERGKLHIHDPICTYLSPCPQSWQQITIYHLLTHSSGIPNHFDPSGINLVQLEKEPLDFKPGTQFNYSNSGYVVLALIIEKVSGEAYGTFLQQNIFAPLQMTHTGYDFTQPQLPNLASGYYSWGDEQDYTGISLEFGADGLYSTVEDLYRWDQAPDCSFVSAADLPPLNPTANASSLAIGYGYGWLIAKIEGSKNPVIYHAGETYGFQAYNTFYSQDNLTIIVLSNLQLPGGLEGIVQRLYQNLSEKG
jgi:CubicO group peptidase (beta-lactamase class C family)